MRRRRKRKQKQEIVLSKKKMAVLVILACALTAGGVFAGILWQSRNAPQAAQEQEADLDEDAVDWTGERTGDPPMAGDQPGIAIPGYKSLALKAGQTEQSVNLYNPAENNCYFVMTLLLPDGTQIWQSKMVEPGKGLYEITLDQPVEAGTYENSTLKYECYRMDEQLTPLNGSEIRLTLEVK